jgi:hypothetical protein
VAELAVPKDQAKFVLCTGYDFMPGAHLPSPSTCRWRAPWDEDVLLVHTWEGKPLAYLLCFPPSNGGRN